MPSNFNTQKDAIEDMIHSLRHLSKIGFSDAEIKHYAIGITETAIQRKHIIIGAPTLPIETEEKSPFDE